MNLIEQLGGYEEAKSSYEWLKQKGYCGGDLDDGALKAALLDYRRANNIFEAGDNFCYADKYSKDDDLDGVAYSSLHTIDDLDFQSGWANEVISRNIIRHATDEEIEAGKRLGVAA